MFGKKSDKQALSHKAKKTKESQHPMAQSFRRAVYGRSFRSRALKSELGEVWLKAVAPVQADQWTVIRMSRAEFVTPADSSVDINTPAWKSKIEAENLDFFDALEHLAFFESSARTLSFEPSGLSEKDLGTEHFKAFGIREGIAFDINTGMPHPTAEGEIVTTGTFSEQMMADVKTAFDKKRKKLSGPETIITSMFGAPPEENSFEDFVSLAKFMPAYSYFMMRLKEAKLCFELALECDFDWRYFKNQEFERNSKDWEVNDHVSLFEEILKETSEALDKLDKLSVDVDSEKIKTFLEQMKFAYYFSWAKALSQRLANTLEEELLEDLQRHTKYCEDRYRKLGGSQEEAARIKDHIINGQSPVMPQELTVFIQGLEDHASRCQANMKRMAGIKNKDSSGPK
jgi:hypothetical protein